MKMKKHRFPDPVAARLLAAAALGLFSLLTTASSARSQTQPPALTETAEVAADVAAPRIPSQGMNQRVSLEFRSTEAADVLKYLAQKAEMNIYISTNVAGRVSLFANEVPIKDIFDIVLRSNGLAYEKVGDLYSIMTENEYKELHGAKFSDTRVVKTFRLQYAVPEMAFNLLDALKSSIGRLLIDEKSGTIMIMDTEQKIHEMEEALSILEQKEVVKVFDLKFANAAEVEEKLKDQFETNRLGTIKADQRTNQLIIRTYHDRMKEVETLITALDRKTREVLIDAKIVKVALSKDLDAGVDWNAVFNNVEFNGVDAVGDFRRATDATTPGSEVPNVTPISVGPKFGLDKNGPFGKEQFGELIFTTINRDGYELFRYLRSLGETKIISKPRLLVTENQAAKIHVGTREAYVTTTTTTGTSTSTTAEEVQFIDVGIKFLVTPKITKDGYIEMTVSPEVSSVVRTLETQSGNKIPIVDTSIAETKVVVKDGFTVVIGGLRENADTVDDDEVPGMSRIPLIGKAVFKKQRHNNHTSELIIFITPHIVGGDKLVTGTEDTFGGGFKSYRDYNNGTSTEAHP